MAVQHTQDRDGRRRHMEEKNAGSIGDTADIRPQFAALAPAQATFGKRSRLFLQPQDQTIGGVRIVQREITVDAGEIGARGFSPEEPAGFNNCFPSRPASFAAVFLRPVALRPAAARTPTRIHTHGLP
jgi:hypothetical protein